LVRKDNTVEFDYPVESAYQHPDFEFDRTPDNRSVIFSNKNSTYKIYEDRKSTRLNSSHVKISYAVFCLKNKTGRGRPAPRLLQPPPLSPAPASWRLDRRLPGVYPLSLHDALPISCA